MGVVNRGFRGRRPDADPARILPGQYLTPDFPVLSAGPTSRTPLNRWSFAITADVDVSMTWSWAELRALPSETVTVDTALPRRLNATSRPQRQEEVA